MPKLPTKESELIKAYLHRFPDTPNASLAKKIYADHSKVFSSVEQIRTTIRYWRGAQGDFRRKHVADTTHKKELAFSDKNRYGLPQSYGETRKVFKLPAANNNVLVISDLHVPYHDVDAINLAIDYGKKNHVNTIFINGDLIDFHRLSRFEPDPLARDVREEFDLTKELLTTLRKAFPKAGIYWLKGNHDNRYEKWLYQKAPEIFDDPYYRLEERLQLNKLKIKLIDDNYLVKMGKLNVTHGHLTIRGVFAPVNSARGVYLRTKVSTLISHVHNSSEHTEKDLNDGMVTCWSIGCLCTLTPNYDPMNTKHNHGFAHVQFTRSGAFSVNNIRIHEGRIM